MVHCIKCIRRNHASHGFNIFNILDIGISRAAGNKENRSHRYRNLHKHRVTLLNTIRIHRPLQYIRIHRYRNLHKHRVTHSMRWAQTMCRAEGLELKRGCFHDILFFVVFLFLLFFHACVILFLFCSFHFR